MSIKMTEYVTVKSFKQFVFLILIIKCRSSVSQLCNANAYAEGHVDGQCVPFDDCPRLLQILKSPEITRAEIRILQNLTCEKDYENPTICCALNDLKDDSKYKYNVQSNSHVPSSNRLNHNMGAIVYPTDTDYEPISFNSQDQSSPNNISLDVKKIDDPSLQPLDRFGKQNHKNFGLLPALKDCGHFLSSSRIVGGWEANHGDYPWMARIGYKSIGADSNNETEFYCGGTVINKRYILLAAHCSEEIDSSEIEPYIVRLGEHNTETDIDCSDYLKTCSRVKDYGIEKVIPHKGYNTDDKSNDIELIRVDRDISFETPFIRPICLPFAHEYKIEQYLRTDDLEQFVGKMGSVTGWGRTKWNKAEGSKILQQVFLPIVSNEECQRNYSSRIAISDLQMCAGGVKNMDSCSGDSGGCLVYPLKFRDEKGRNTVKYFQLGVVSFGPVHCGVGGLPGVYSRVTKYKNWILDHLEP